MKDYTPSPYLTFSVHLDGVRERHDASVCQDGVFERAVEAIREARARGFRVTVNCTLFQDEQADEVAQFIDECMALDVEGVTIAPGLQLRARAEAGGLPQAPRREAAVPRRVQARARAGAGASTTRASTWTSWPATRTTSAPPGATRPATCSAGRSPATCWWARATRTATRTW